MTVADPLTQTLTAALTDKSLCRSMTDLQLLWLHTLHTDATFGISKQHRTALACVPNADMLPDNATIICSDFLKRPLGLGKGMSCVTQLRLGPSQILERVLRQSTMVITTMSTLFRICNVLCPCLKHGICKSKKPSFLAHFDVPCVTL